MVLRFVAIAFLALVFWLWLAMPICGCSSREGAYYAAMKSDLRDLAAQQEIYYSEHRTYTTRPEDLAFTNSDGVIVHVRLHDSDKAWSARTVHLSHRTEDGEDEGQSCAIHYGSEGTVPQADIPRTNVHDLAPSAPGEIVCDYRRPFSIRRIVMEFLFDWV